jgi:hypothetical protein
MSLIYIYIERERERPWEETWVKRRLGAVITHLLLIPPLAK